MKKYLPRTRAYWQDIVRARKHTEASSFGRYAVDRMLTMLLGRVSVPGKDRERKLKFRDGVILTYRLNRGDMQSIREVWLEQAYRLPSSEKRNVLVDLGAHIGLTSLWLAREYGFQQIVCVEPVQSNARLARQNLKSNGIKAEIIEVAIGPMDGKAHFEENAVSNMGRVGERGHEVQMVCMASLLRKLPPGQLVDLLKIDIEGGEQALLTEGDTSWLSRVREIIIEFHHEPVDYKGLDYKGLIGLLKNAGFDRVPRDKPDKGAIFYFRRR
jgi:FkbM family methyltransferase